MWLRSQVESFKCATCSFALVVLKQILNLVRGPQSSSDFGKTVETSRKTNSWGTNACGANLEVLVVGRGHRPLDPCEVSRRRLCARLMFPVSAALCEAPWGSSAEVQTFRGACQLTHRL